MKRAPQIRVSERAFREGKRAEFKAARAALEVLWNGSYYLPEKCQERLREATQALISAQSFGRAWWNEAKKGPKP